MNIKLGADPEIFLTDIFGQLRSSIGKIGGSKVSPRPLTDLGDGYAVQEDNVAMEFNIPPASNAKEFTHNISTALKYLNDMVGTALGYQIGKQSAVSFPPEELMDPAAQEFGCDPDYNAWTGERNPRPAAEDKNLRSCGGHIHIGFDRSKVDTRSIIQMMDLHIGVPSVIMDKGDLRKNLYGKAGAYREAPHGAEYRTPSNFWIFDPKLTYWVWNNTERAVDAAVAQFTLGDDDKASVINAINNNDVKLAKQLVKKFNLEVVA